MKKVVITGGTGFIGRHLAQHLTNQGYHITLITRRMPASSVTVPAFTWDEVTQKPAMLEGTDAIINLAGESINQRWNRAVKSRILESRIRAAETVAQWMNQLEAKPKVVINGSAVGIYGHAATRRFTETDVPPADDYLALVVRAWEQAAEKIGCERIVMLRTGVVLGRDGGALPKMTLPYRLFAGGRIGRGNQWLSWIHIQDMLRIVQFCLEHESIRGAVNCTAPHPATNEEFGRKLGQALRRPHYLPVPAALFKLLLGEMSSLLLEGQYVLPQKLLDHGFSFKYRELDEALRHLLVDSSQSIH